MLTDVQKTDVRTIAKALKELDYEGLQLTSAVVACLLAKQNMETKHQQQNKPA